MKEEDHIARMMSTVPTPRNDELGDSIRSFKAFTFDPYNKVLLEKIAVRVEQLIAKDKS